MCKLFSQKRSPIIKRQTTRKNGLREVNTSLSVLTRGKTPVLPLRNEERVIGEKEKERDGVEEKRQTGEEKGNYIESFNIIEK